MFWSVKHIPFTLKRHNRSLNTGWRNGFYWTQKKISYYCSTWCIFYSFMQKQKAEGAYWVWMFCWILLDKTFWGLEWKTFLKYCKYTWSTNFRFKSPNPSSRCFSHSVSSTFMKTQYQTFISPVYSFCCFSPSLLCSCLSRIAVLSVYPAHVLCTDLYISSYVFLYQIAFYFQYCAITYIYCKKRSVSFDSVWKKWKINNTII